MQFLIKTKTIDMTAKEYYNKKSIELGYDDFMHYCDCGDLEQMPNNIINWTDEFHKSKVEAVRDEVIKYLERMIKNCDEIKGMQREKAVFQTVLKKYRQLLKQ